METNKTNCLALSKVDGQHISHPLNSFNFKKEIGVGAYGTVELVEKNGHSYALKKIQKKQLQKEEKVYQALIEKELLKKMEHPGIIKLLSSFQDRRNVYFLLQHCERGDLTSFIRLNYHQITFEMQVFYTAEIVLCLEYLQKIKVIHRDLKPSNILMTKDNHLKLIDFGTAEISQCTILQSTFKQKLEFQKSQSQKTQIDNDVNQNQDENQDANERKLSEDSLPNSDELRIPIVSQRKATFVGTCYYLSPELLEESSCSLASDLWALGCIIYELFTFQLPFDGNSDYQIFQKIINVDYKFPQNCNIPSQAIDLIQKLLQKNPQDRLGSNSREGLMFEDLKAHPFFSSISDFSDKLFSCKAPNFVVENNPAPLDSASLSAKQKLDKQIQQIENDMNLLYSGVIQKRTFINYNSYYLAIMNDLSLIRIKTEEPQKKVRIQIDVLMRFETKNKKPAQLIDSGTFKLVTKQKTYKLKSSQAAAWVEKINQQYDYLVSVNNGHDYNIVVHEQSQI